MQNRMKTNQLSAEQIETLLLTAMTASVGTINADNTPYVTPVHFVYCNDRIYFHGLPKGQKLDNIALNPNVSVAVYECDGLLLDKNNTPCGTNTDYRSVIVQGKAKVLTLTEEKRFALTEIVKKYTPHLADKQLPDNMINGTAVVQIDVREITGKHYG